MTSARQLWEEAWKAIVAGDGTRLGELFAPDAELSTSSAGGRGVEYVQGVFRRHLEAYPDLRHEILDVVESADGSAVAVELMFSGSHRGTLRHPDGSVIPPTGKALSWKAVDKVRCADGRIVSWHALFDRLHLLQQLQAGTP